MRRLKGNLVFAEHLRRKNEINQKFSKENDKKCNKSRNFVHNVGSYHKKTHYQQKLASAGFLRLYSHVFFSATDGCRCPPSPSRP